MESPTSIRSADDGMLLSASQRKIALDASPAYSASGSSEAAGRAADVGSDVDAADDAAPAGGSFVPSLFDSFVPLPSTLDEVAPSERGVSLDASRSIDLGAGLAGAPDITDAAALTPAAGYLSDSQVLPTGPRGGDGLEPYRPVLKRSATRPRGHAALKHALAREGTVAPGQPGRVRRVRDKVMNVELGQDEASEEVRRPLLPFPYHLCTRRLCPRACTPPRGCTSLARTRAVALPPGTALQSLSADARRINVSAFCLAYEFDIVELEAALRERFGGEHVAAFPEDLKAGQTADIVHSRYVNETGDVCGDVFCFEVRPPLPLPPYAMWWPAAQAREHCARACSSASW